jgi:spermidine synthase
VLTVLVFVGLDQLLAWLPGHAKTITGSFCIGLRVAMWTIVAALVVSWIARKKFRNFPYWRFVTCMWLFLGLLGLGRNLWMQANEANSDRVFRSRNFYGVLTVYEHEKNTPLSHYFLLQHGRITHGLQFADPVQARWPVSYYGKESGIGLGVAALPAGRRRIGVVGLGTGTMAAFARAGDYLRFYEINPQVKAVATSWFSYLPKCPGNVEVAPGDARLTLEREPPQHFDLLVLDAFSSDAIPVHLLTKEAFETYERHLNTNAIIAVHISNHYLNLEPVVVNLARHFGYKLATIDFEENDEEWWLYGSTWILLSHSDQIINRPEIQNAADAISTNAVKVPLWTDDFASLFQILR